MTRVKQANEYSESVDIEFVDVITEFTRNCKNAARVKAITEQWHYLMDGIGATFLQYNLVPHSTRFQNSESRLITVIGSQNDWESFYTFSGFEKDDPLLNYARNANAVSLWTDYINAPDQREWDSLYKKTLSRFDVGFGLALPIFGLRGSGGFFLMGFKPNREPLSERDMSLLQWALQASHRRYCDLTES